MARFGWTLAAGLVLAPAAPVPGQITDEGITTLALDAPVSAVTVYGGRAAVTRSVQLQFDAGVYELVFADLPRAAHPDTIQARVSGGATILGLEYEQRQADESSVPRVAELDAEIERIQANLRAIEEDRVLLEKTEDFIDGLAMRAELEAVRESGTESLDIDAVREQLAFVVEQREKLLQRRRDLDANTRELDKRLPMLHAERAGLSGDDRMARTVIALVAVPHPGDLTVDLTYLVSEATWEPTYNLRASTGSWTVTVEYDALIRQRTGEDWNNVAMTLSTAQPTIAANPPVLPPWYVDLAPAARQRRSGAPAVGPESTPSEASPMAEDWGRQVERWSAAAEVAGEGPSVTFLLPRPVTVQTDARKRQRTRIGELAAPAEFIHVAIPLFTEAVFIRADLTNASDYQFLAGPASIFLDQDYVGPTRLPAVAPEGRLNVYFGIDRAVTAKRTLLRKATTRTGLLGGGRKTSYEYRVQIDNNTGKPVVLELWDRYPVSRTDQIQIEPINLSHPLATDVDYVEQKKPQGLMKWMLNVPASASGGAAMAVMWGVEVNRAKDLEMTPLPE